MGRSRLCSEKPTGFDATEQEIAALSAQMWAARELVYQPVGLAARGYGEAGCGRSVPGAGNRGQPQPRATADASGRRGAGDNLLLVDGDVRSWWRFKSTLRVKEVRKFLEDLKWFSAFFPEYQGYRLFGTVAALGVDESADRYAYRQGLFVLTLGHEGLVTLRNDCAFRPKDFAVGPVDRC